MARRKKAKRKAAKSKAKRVKRPVRRRYVEPTPQPKSRFAPLNTAFLVSSIIGFLISVVYIPKYSLTWAFTFGFVFFIMFIAAMLSMARANPDDQLLPRPRRIK